MGMLSGAKRVTGMIFSSSCLSSLNSDEVLAGLSGMMIGGALASRVFGKVLHDAFEGFCRRGILVVKRGKDGFFLEWSILWDNGTMGQLAFLYEVMKVEML